jgi:hypothetical protein
MSPSFLLVDAGQFSGWRKMLVARESIESN